MGMRQNESTPQMQAAMIASLVRKYLLNILFPLSTEGETYTSI